MSGVTAYTEEIASQICERIANGESLRSITRDPGMPAQSTVFKWLIQQQSFAEQYAYARESQADTLADELLDIADDSRNDWVERMNKDGEPTGTFVPDQEVINRSRLRVDTRKWIASKLKPKKYGDKTETTHVGDKERPIVLTPADADI